MITLAKMLGGSHSYGLNTPTSDIDERFIYAYDDVANIIGLDKNECIDTRNTSIDSLGYEIRRYLSLLKKSNTQVIEFLFIDDEKFIEIHPIFKIIRENKYNLIDQDKLYKSLKGYIYGEIRLANGERTGDLGSKRKEQLAKYGYSPKNASHILRLAECGRSFFTNGIYPVDIKKYKQELYSLLMKIKTEPEAFDKVQLNTMFSSAEKLLDEAYTVSLGKPKLSNYNHDLANKILFDVYYPILGALATTELHHDKKTD